MYACTPSHTTHTHTRAHGMHMTSRMCTQIYNWSYSVEYKSEEVLAFIVRCWYRWARFIKQSLFHTHHWCIHSHVTYSYLYFACRCKLRTITLTMSCDELTWGFNIAFTHTHTHACTQTCKILSAIYILLCVRVVMNSRRHIRVCVCGEYATKS